MGRFAGLIALIGAACSPPGAALQLPARPADGAVILALQDGEGGRQIFGFDDELPIFSAEDLAEVVLISYPVELGTFGIVPGRLDDRVEDGVPLPTFGAIFFSSKVSLGQPGPFEMVPTLPSWLAEVRIEGPPQTSFQACAEAGGCYLDEAAQRALVCTTPCPIAPPVIAPPQPVDMRPCPAGWAEITDGPHVRCAPPPRVPECPDGEVQWIDAVGCAPLGPTCPPGGYAMVSGPGRRIHVMPGAIGGDGSALSPFGLLSSALGSAGRGDAILIGPGRLRLDTAAVVGPEVSVYGACARAGGTILEATTSALEITSSSTIARLRLEAGADAITVRTGARVHLEDLELIGQGTGRAIVAYGALDGRSLKSRRFSTFADIQPDAGPVHLARIDAALHGATGIELRAGPFIVKDAIIHQGQGAAIAGRELGAARVDLERVWLDDHLHGTLVLGGADARLTHILLTDTAQAPAPDGHGFYQDGGVVIGRFIYLARHPRAGLWLFGGGGAVEDLWVEDLLDSVAIEVQGQTTPRRPVALLVHRFYSVGVGRSVGVTADADVTIEDLTIAAPTRPFEGLACGNNGAGPQRVTIRRAELEGAFNTAAFLSHGRPSVTLEDFAVRPGAKNGLYVPSGAAILRRVSIEGLVPTADGEGLAIGVGPGQSLDADGFSIDQGGKSGVGLMTEDYRLDNGVITRCRYGMSILTPRFADVTRRIRFMDNGAAIFVSN